MEKDEIKCDVPYVEKGDPADTRLRMWAHFLLLLSRFSSNLILKCKDVWSVIRVKCRKQIMLWCLIFHSAELQNYVPALHGIMFGSFNFNIKHHNIICFLNLTLITYGALYIYLLTCVGSISLITRQAVFLSLVQFCSAPPNYVRNAATRIMFGK